MKKILLAEDDSDLAFVISQLLEMQNYTVNWIDDGKKALSKLQEEKFDLCILDVMMPELDGFTVAEKIAKNKFQVPFLFLTARNSQQDKVQGLQLGAEDYITKPFDTEEFLLRIEKILKRNQPNTSEKIITIADCSLDCERLILTTKNKLQQLTEKEAALLLYLNKNQNRLLKREEILRAVWQTTDFFAGRSMDVYLSKLRKYFAENDKIKIESTRHLGLEFKIIPK